MAMRTTVRWCTQPGRPLDYWWRDRGPCAQPHPIDSLLSLFLPLPLLPPLPDLSKAAVEGSGCPWPSLAGAAVQLPRSVPH